jgi:chemotaxis protein methyltransferase CheR
VHPLQHHVDNLEDLEIDLLLEGLFRHYGYDFRQYARSSLRRRLWRRVYAENLDSLSGLQERVLHDPAAMDRLLLDLSVNVTSMFRDPTFHAAFRSQVVPLLRTYPFVRIWNAGCSSGEETYSLAILLLEEGLYDRTRIYATDINEAVLDLARAGSFPADKLPEYTQNYRDSGGQGDLAKYHVVVGDRVRFSRSLRENIVFAQHNLASDRSFNEFHVIICRNVLIYFAAPLQERVHALFHESLVRLGVLGLGHKETVRFTSWEDRYEELNGRERLYRKVA